MIMKKFLVLLVTFVTFATGVPSSQRGRGEKIIEYFDGLHAIHPSITPSIEALNYRVNRPTTNENHTEVSFLTNRDPILPPDVDFDCTGKPEGNYVHPTECTRFIMCTTAELAYDMPCPDCGQLANPYMCDYSNYLNYNFTLDWCDWPRNTPCGTTPVTHSPTTTTRATTTTTTTRTTTTTTPKPPKTTTVPAPVDGGLCPAGQVADQECNPKSDEECKCGTCRAEGLQFVFEYFWCNISNPEDPSEARTPGKWVHQVCSEDDVWNPHQGTSGDCHPDWTAVDPGIQQEYFDLGCFPDHICEDDGVGSICDSASPPKNGDPCDIRADPSHCSCGQCEYDPISEESSFWHFTCVPQRPGEDPRNYWVGKWNRTECGPREVYNPAEKSCTSWEEMKDEDVKNGYLEKCFKRPEPCKEEAEVCPSDIPPTHKKPCDPFSTDCRCGHCVGDGAFRHYFCDRHEPANPFDPWTGDWLGGNCGVEEFYNPVTGSCTSEWDDLNEETKEEYMQPPCFNPPNCTESHDAGEICDVDVREDGSCNPARVPCNCGRCLANVTFEYFDCVPVAPTGNPHRGWTGIRKGKNCPAKHFYNPDSGSCVSSWFHLPTPVQDEYRADKTCVPVPCEEGQEEGWQCSNVYYSRFDEDYDVLSCASGRYYDPATRGCRPCKEVAGCSTCHSCTVSGDKPNKTVSCH